MNGSEDNAGNRIMPLTQGRAEYKYENEYEQLCDLIMANYPSSQFYKILKRV